MAFFKDLLAGLTKPFRSTGEAAIYAAKALYDPRSVEGYNPVFTSQDEFSQYMANPVKQATKDAAGAIAFGVPGGVGLKGGLKAGAAAGALGGYGASTEGNELNDILFGTVAGGALGGAIGGIGSKLGGKKIPVGSRADDILDDIVRGDTTVAQSRSIDKVTKRSGAYRKALKELGVEVSDAETTALQAGQKANELADLKRQILAESGYKMQGDDLLNALNKTKSFKDNPSLLQNDDLKIFFETMNSRALEKGGFVDAQDLYDVVRAIDDDLYDIAGTRTTPRTNDGNRALKALRDALSNEIKGVEGVAKIDKQLSPIYEYLKYDAPYALRRQSGSQPIVQAPGVPLSAKVGTGKFVNKGWAKLANTLTSIGDKTTPTMPSRATSLMGLLTGVGGSTPQGEDIQEVPQQGLESILPMQEAPQVDREQQVADLTLQLFLETGDLKEASTMAELLVTSKFGGAQKNAKMTEKQRSYQEAGMQAQEALGMLQGGGIDTGPIAGRLEGIQQMLGMGQADDTEYRALISGARTAIRNALLGANMSDREMESLAGFIPEFTDTPQVAQIKLQKFIESTQRYAGQETQPSQEDLMQMLGGY